MDLSFFELIDEVINKKICKLKPKLAEYLLNNKTIKHYQIIHFQYFDKTFLNKTFSIFWLNVAIIIDFLIDFWSKSPFFHFRLSIDHNRRDYDYVIEIGATLFFKVRTVKNE